MSDLHTQTVLNALAGKTEETHEIKDEHWFPCTFLYRIKNRNLYIFRLSNGETVWADGNLLGGKFVPKGADAAVRMQRMPKIVGADRYGYQALEVRIRPSVFKNTFGG